MAIFLRLLDVKDKEIALKNFSHGLRSGISQEKFCYEVNPEVFRSILGAPFSYWANNSALDAFKLIPVFKGIERLACVTNPVGEDKRFYRLWWEIESAAVEQGRSWVPLAKGGKFSPFYFDLNLIVKWCFRKGTYVGFTGTEHRPIEKPASVDFFFKPGLSWPQRTSSGLGMRVLPAGAVFSTKGPGAFVSGFDELKTLAMLAICSSRPFRYLVNLQLAAADAAARSYEVGIINRTPFPEMDGQVEGRLAELARRAWSIKHTQDTTEEISHAFVLPVALHTGESNRESSFFDSELSQIQSDIDDIAFELYSFSDEDRTVLSEAVANEGSEAMEGDSDDDSDEPEILVDMQTELLSWSVGGSFGRFDWRLATGDRELPPQPKPFDPLPAKSPGMLHDGDEPFHAHQGILVDDQGHPHDLPHLVEEMLGHVNMPVPDNVRRWLQKDFFAFHLRRYSKSRRKAPIYWPLATASCSYTLWIYYPHLSNQTLFKAVNDFVDGPNGKLTQVSRDCVELRVKGSGRSRDEEKQYEVLQTFEQELTDLRDTLLKIASSYQPNHDDGVQITAAPLWPLFRHKSWQKVLKDTWAKLEKGEYDWAHLAMSYWPERVRQKCKTDKSLAIAHGLEDLYVEPEAAPKKAREKKKAGANE